MASGKSPMFWAGILGALFVVATLVVLISLMQQQVSQGYSCEVCISFAGRTQCREAVAPTPEQATRAAVDNACAGLAGGMTQTLECSRVPPDSQSCRETR